MTHPATEALGKRFEDIRRIDRDITPLTDAEIEDVYEVAETFVGHSIPRGIISIPALNEYNRLLLVSRAVDTMTKQKYPNMKSTVRRREAI